MIELHSNGPSGVSAPNGPPHRAPRVAPDVPAGIAPLIMAIQFDAGRISGSVSPGIGINAQASQDQNLGRRDHQTQARLSIVGLHETNRGSDLSVFGAGRNRRSTVSVGSETRQGSWDPRPGVSEVWTADYETGRDRRDVSLMSTEAKPLLDQRRPVLRVAQLRVRYCRC